MNNLSKTLNKSFSLSLCLLFCGLTWPVVLVTFLHFLGPSLITTCSKKEEREGSRKRVKGKERIRQGTDRGEDTVWKKLPSSTFHRFVNTATFLPIALSFSLLVSSSLLLANVIFQLKVWRPLRSFVNCHLWSNKFHSYFQLSLV